MAKPTDHERRLHRLRSKYPNRSRDAHGHETFRTDDRDDPTKRSHHPRFPTQTLTVPADEHLPARLTIPISPIGDAFYEQASRIPGLNVIRPDLALELTGPLDEFPDRLEALADLFHDLKSKDIPHDPARPKYLDSNWKWLAKRTRDTLRDLAKSIRGSRTRSRPNTTRTANWVDMVGEADDPTSDPESPHYLYQRDLRYLPDRV